MKLKCNGTVINDGLNLSLDKDEVNKLYYILLTARIGMDNDPLYADVFDYSSKLLDIVNAWKLNCKK